MVAKTLISNIIVPLRTSDSGENALEAMNDFHVRHLPVVNDKELLGLVSEDDILDNDASQAIGTYALSLPKPCVFGESHLYELMKLMADYNLTVVPVIDNEQEYLGLVTMEDVLHNFAKTLPFSEPGSIIVLEMAKRDYVLSEISRIVESENAVILSAYVTNSQGSSQIEVTLKVSNQQINAILASFERYEYNIKASFNEVEYIDTLKERYELLMNYLNV
jgi:acetoin utilization protein AcuB